MKELLIVKINGQCQLHCPHCYINMHEWPRTLMSNESIDALPVSEYEKVAIVATEPFFNEGSLRATMRLGKRVRQAGRMFSVVTNALGLAQALKREPELATILSWIDISMDVPGNIGYQRYRGGSWRRFLEGVLAAHDHDIEVSILNTVSSQTLPFFDEMLSVSEELSSDFFTVSPVLITESRQTEYQTKALNSIRQLFEIAVRSTVFQKSNKVILDIGATACKQSGEDMRELKAFAEKMGISDKVEFDPRNIDKIADRVTVKGRFILPSEAFKTAQD